MFLKRSVFLKTFKVLYVSAVWQMTEGTARAAQNAGREANALWGRAGPHAWAGGLGEMNPWHLSITPKVSLFDSFSPSRFRWVNISVYFQVLSRLPAPTGKRMTAVTAVHGIPSGSLPLLLRLAKRRIARSVASGPAKRARGGTGNQVYSLSLLNILLNIFTSLNLLQKINAHLILFNVFIWTLSCSS